MKGMLALLLAFSVLLPQQEPPEFPPGLSCSPRGVINTDGTVVDKDHPCHCARMQHPKEENGCCEGAPVEDPQCSQWCRPNHCSCPVLCSMHPLPPQGETPDDQDHH